MKGWLTGLILTVALPLGVAGQEPGPPPRPQPGPGEEAWKLVDAYIISNLQESLGLSDEQFVKLLPLVKKLQEERRGFMQKRGQLLGEIRHQLRSGEATEARIAELMKQLHVLETEEPAALRRQADAVDALLSPVQQAKFRVLEMEVERRIRELRQQIRRGGERNPQRERRPPGPVPTPDPLPQP